MTTRDFNLPDLGEGLTEGEILAWLVAVGDEVKLNQPIVEVETAKAAVEIPTPYAGTVIELVYPAGTTVDVGRPIIRISDGVASDAAPATVTPMTPATPPAGSFALTQSIGFPDIEAPAGPSSSPAPAAQPPAPAAEPAVPAAEPPAVAPQADMVPQKREAVLVGYGVRTGEVTRRPRVGGADRTRHSHDAPPERAVQALAAVFDTATADPAAAAAAAEPAAATPRPAASRPSGMKANHALAAPPVRRLAKDLGVDLAAVTPTGPNGTVTRADVVGHADSATVDAVVRAPAAFTAVPASDEDVHTPVKGVRKVTAEAMVASAFTAPHVTLFMTVDMTASMDLVARYRTLPEFAGVRVSPLLLVAKALLAACRRNPGVNAKWVDLPDGSAEIVQLADVNLGIAAATPRGLLVPNIKGAQRLSLRDLAGALGELTEVARAGRTTPADMARGTITITNVGTFGVDNGTPILNPGEAAILCFGAVRDTPWVVDGAIAVRKVTQLTLSFDHRLVDGALGASVLSDVGRALADPALLLAWA